ncbi:nucleoside 2-deoxyribosyltransferase domain-containing protein [Candidatus Parabeggiatoa sp. HSG14]|uniref:nucleoside 2-deoxyribosyltransferase domain-containing protein n=1 Tax=Candidatus Parabeggiatoa sp. HSG14 TaxID=3055593 RepID=UPI0025A6A573|nr:nucleoside 2-deoxyribosyltransferase domain-containing protein [Thiotrichales bacterium HSG14]
MIIPVYAFEEAPLSYSASIFLAGPTPRKDDIKSWRPEALQLISELIENYNIEIVVFIPEPRSGIDSINYLEQVEWEKRYLEMADTILIWMPRDMKTSLKGLTTNIEFGKYVESGKLFYGRPKKADKTRYLDWMYTDITGQQPLNTLAMLADEVVTDLYSKLEQCANSIKKIRKDGERYVPLHIWTTPQFQSWYQRQQKAGNELINAKVLWTFIIHKVNFIFSYALYVKVWVAAEERIKSNEFIISRPDISVVVAYWKHPSILLESEIVLIKEFRSPARTEDGFIHELPGGSSFKQGNPLQLASEEFYEETNLKIQPERLRHLDSKQLMATWSTHFANVYAVELEQSEIEQAKQLAASGKTFGVEDESERTYVEVCQLKDIGKYIDWSMEGMIYRAIFNN